MTREDPRTLVPDQEYLALAEPWETPDGLVVQPMGSIHGLLGIGLHFNNALGSPSFATGYARIVDQRHVYQVLLDGIPISCGEIMPSGDGIRLEWDRGHDNRNGSPESLQAVEGFVAAANAGEVELNYAIEDGRFVAREPAPRP